MNTVKLKCPYCGNIEDVEIELTEASIYICRSCLNTYEAYFNVIEEQVPEIKDTE